MAVTFYFARHGETVFNVEGKVQGWADSPLSPRGIYSAYKLGLGLVDVDLVGACVSDADRARDTLSIALESRENERARLCDSLFSASDEAVLTTTDSSPWDELGDPFSVERAESYLRESGLLRPGAGAFATAGDNATPSPEDEQQARAESWRPSSEDLQWMEYPTYTIASPPWRACAEPRIPVRCDTRLREWCFGDLEGQPTVKLRNRLYDLFGDDIPRAEQNKRIDEIANYLYKTDKSHRAENFETIAVRIASFLDDCGSTVERIGGGNVLVVTHAMLIRALVFMFDETQKDDPSRIANASLTKVTWDNGAVSIESVGDTSHLEPGYRPSLSAASFSGSTPFGVSA